MNLPTFLFDDYRGWPGLVILIISIILSTSALAQEPHTLEKIVVKPDVSSSEKFSDSDIKQKNLNSLVDLLDQFAGLDLRYRGQFGIQGDLSLRGSTYEQVAVLIDGLRVIDPQTGHHNLDIPLTTFDVQRIEVTKEGSSSLYGAGALAGSINFVTKKPTKKALNLQTLFGEHALFGGGFSFSLPQEDFSTRVSFEHKVSKAARPNTDFEYKTASFYLNRDWDNASFDTLFGYQKKDFGADSFYSNLFPEEEEHTETFFVRTGLDSELAFGSLKDNLFFRKHRDKFILRRNSPTSVNYHTTYAYGLNSGIDVPMRYGGFSFGLDTARDEIYSTNLGKHARLYEAGSVGFTPELPDKLSADARARTDHYQKWGFQESYNLGLGYVVKEGLRIKGSFAHAFRLPSFTELYYSDSANKGNPDLEIEESDNFRAGVDYRLQDFYFNLDGFLRRGHNLIDWTRTQETEAWTATNLGQVDFKGLEFSSRVRPGLNWKGFRLTELIFSYNYTEANKKTTGFSSKYALDILRHKLILEGYCAILGLNLNWQVSYNQRYYGETYFVGDLYIGKKIITKNCTIEPFMKIDNFSNTKYTEISGVLQPGRWIKSGLKFEW